MTWVEEHEGELLQAWKECRENWGEEVAQEAITYTMKYEPRSPMGFALIIGRRLHKQRFHDGRIPDRRKDRREVVETGSLMKYQGGGEDAEAECMIDRGADPARIMEAREELQRFPGFMLQAVLDGAYEPTGGSTDCNRGHPLREHAVYYRKPKGKITRHCRMCSHLNYEASK